MYSPISLLTIKNTVIEEIDQFAFRENQFQILPAEQWKSFSWEGIRAWMHFRGIYAIPTIELCEWLDSIFANWKKRTIEVGAGTGLFQCLGIKQTDSRYQDRPEIRLYYQSINQPIIQYPDFVEKIDAISAVEKYNPHTVLASWCTQKSFKTSPKDQSGCAGGIEWNILLGKIKRLIFIGSHQVHKDMSIRSLEHEELWFPWIISRAQNPEDNFIGIWQNKKWLNRK